MALSNDLKILVNATHQINPVYYSLDQNFQKLYEERML